MSSILAICGFAGLTTTKNDPNDDEDSIGNGKSFVTSGALTPHAGGGGWDGTTNFTVYTYMTATCIRIPSGANERANELVVVQSINGSIDRSIQPAAGRRGTGTATFPFDVRGAFVTRRERAQWRAHGRPRWWSPVRSNDDFHGSRGVFFTLPSREVVREFICLPVTTRTIRTTSECDHHICIIIY